jgi:hypothetical protein
LHNSSRFEDTSESRISNSTDKDNAMFADEGFNNGLSLDP